MGLLILSASSCSLTKGLSDDQLVYMGSEMNISDPDNEVDLADLELNISSAAPKGTRTGLGNIYTGIHNIYDTAGDSGFRNWVKNRLGEAPVIFDNTMIANTEARLTYYLNGKGYFAHSATCDSTREDRKVTLQCDVKLGNRYQVDSVIFPVDSTYAALKLDDKLKRAIIKNNTYYDRDKLEYERLRLSQLAGNMGFADFGNENIIYYVDTTKGDHKVDLYLEVLQPNDSTYHTRYTLDSIILYPNYTINDNSNKPLKKTEIKKGIYVYESDHYLDHKLLDRLIISETGKWYNRSSEQASINRLLDLGLFRFININNESTVNGKKGNIVQKYLITPERMQSISGEFEVNNRSGNYFGTGASVSYIHKNIFGHAERLKLSLSGQVEAQLGDGLSFINSSDVNVSGEIAFPRFIVPFIDIKESRNFIPRTIINTTFTYQRRIQFYTLESAVGKYGYRWRETSRKLHELYPININQVFTTDKTPEFQEILDDDVRLRKSFDNVLIAGLQYYYTYSNQSSRADRKYKYFRGELETSGNLLGLISSGNADDPAQIAGLSFAQYVKTTVDYRRYFPIGDADIATRIILGAGFTYGNSSELPYIKQYLIGGSNSLRAFRLRGIGPGGSGIDLSETDPIKAQFVDQTGDMKIEANVEYRFPLFSFLKGALFVDAGNIWLIANEDLPAGNFNFDEFYTQIGVGTGFGLRVDFDFFLIRMDIAFPLRSPDTTGEFRWVASDIDLLGSSWRSENLRYNLGIGYPF